MNLPTDAKIAPEKLTQYLLKWLPRNDKSQWLASAGYTVDNWLRLERDIRSQLLSLDAEEGSTTAYGAMYEIRGPLTGPNGVILAVRSIWMTETEGGMTKLVTLYPDKEVPS